MKCPYCKQAVHGKAYRVGKLIMIDFIVHDMSGRQLELREHTCKFELKVKQ